MRVVGSVLLLVAGLLVIAWAILGVYVTLAGSVEREAINDDAVAYWKHFLWYLVRLTGVEFFSGLLLFSIGIMGLAKLRKTK
jgi:hypothetical protein